MKRFFGYCFFIAITFLSSSAIAESVRERISDRTINVLFMSYDYSFLPLTEKKTVVITRDDWINFVVADLRRICGDFGGQPKELVEDPFTKEKKPIGGIPSSASTEWVCTGGKDPFSVKTYVGRFGVNLTLPVSRFVRDVYIVIEHENPQPFVLEKKMEKLVSEYKELQDKSFKGFLKKQELGVFQSLIKLADPSLWAYKIYEDGSAYAQYKISITTDVNTYGRFFHLYNIIPYCKALGGVFREADGAWFYDKKIGVDGRELVSGYIVDGEINGVFYCEGGENPFTVKVQYKRSRDEFAIYDVYFKKGLLEVKKEDKKQQSSPTPISSKEDEIALKSAKFKTDGEANDGFFSYKGVYNNSKNNCDYVSIVKSGQEKQELWNYEICDGVITNKEYTIPVTIGREGEIVIESVKNTARIKGKAFGSYGKYTIIGSAYGVNNCAVEIKVFDDWKMIVYRTFDNCSR